MEKPPINFKQERDFNGLISHTFDFIKQEFDGAKYIAHCEDIEKTELKNMPKAKKTLILIGPEGDFSQKEIGIALQNNFKSVSLGKSRLRTETAGIVAVNSINIKN